MKILVAGGAGFVGTNLIKRLLKEEHEVISVDNYSTGFKENHQDGCVYYDRDLSKSNWSLLWDECECEISCECHIESVDLIFNVAALARIQPSLSDPIKAISNNFNSALYVLEWARSHKTPVVFSGSSTLHHGLWGSPYAWSKYAGEQLCELYNKVYDLPTAICRFYNVYGEHQLEEGAYATVIGIFEKQFREGKPLTITGDGEQRRDFTHIDDIVDGLIRCGIGLVNDQPISGQAYELGRGLNFSINEITEMFGETEVEYIPARKGEYPFTLADYTKAKEELGYSPIKNIRDYIEESLLR
jgi:UDP-glucose 4-epimerase